MEQNKKIKLPNETQKSSQDVSKKAIDVVEQQRGLNLSSSAFNNNESIPKLYSYKGGNINPTLLINNIPGGTKSFALIVDDQDTPAIYVHWLVWNIPADTLKIESGSLPTGSIQGLNDFQKNEYDGPYPPFGTHRYFFKLYSLDTTLDLNKNSRKYDLETAMKGHVLDEALLIGLYSK